MGYNIAILTERRAEPGLDENHTARLELEECIHFHIDEFRFVWTTEDFLKVAGLFAQASGKIKELGAPSKSDKMISLSSDFLAEDECLYPDRWAVELTKDGTVHIHNKSLRVHMSTMDFYEYASRMKQAVASLCGFCKTTIDITADNVVVPSIVDNYLSLLRTYENSETKVAAEKVSELFSRVRWYLNHPKGDATTEDDLQRPDGHLPRKFPGNIPEEINTEYLFSLYESIKKWGYASGPFDGDLMPAYKYPNGKIYLKGAHRTAVLLKLGHSEVAVLLSEAPTGWTVR